jgi:peroxiredoxin
MGKGRTNQPGPLPVGSEAPEFRLPQLGGGERDLSGLRAGGPTLLAFFKISCPVCQLALPFLERIHRESKGNGLRIVGVSQDDGPGTRYFQDEYGLTLPLLLDPEDSGYPVSNGYGLTHVPGLFLIEPDGRISLAVEGFSRRDIQAIGQRAGVNPFRDGDYAPEWKAG